MSMIRKAWRRYCGRKALAAMFAMDYVQAATWVRRSSIFGGDIDN